MYADLKMQLKNQEINCSYPVGNYMFKVNNTNTKIRCEICSKLTLKGSE